MVDLGSSCSLVFDPEPKAPVVGHISGMPQHLQVVQVSVFRVLGLGAGLLPRVESRSMRRFEKELYLCIVVSSS